MYTLHCGDCLEVMRGMAANSVDTVVTDPPYGLSFMGKNWDHGVPGAAFWAEALRVAKPGAMLLAFGGTRTFHRLTVAIEDGGWIIRDVLSWLYGSGFPKSLDLSKAIDKEAGEEREVIGSQVGAQSSSTGKYGGWGNDDGSGKSVFLITAPATPAAVTWSGWGTGLKPAWEPIIMAMKPLAGTYAANAREWGVAGLNVDGGRIGYEPDDMASRIARTGQHAGESYGHSGNVRYSGGEVAPVNPAGRWPANLLLDEDAARALDEASGVTTSGVIKEHHNTSPLYGRNSFNKSATISKGERGFGDTGGASRFFYVAKASRSERNAGLEGMEARETHRYGAGIGRDDTPTSDPNRPAYDTNHHPTVKPLALMRYLCRLTSTPTGGVVLDPFMGSGTTGIACMLEGRQFIGIEKEAEYVEIARRRIMAAELPLMREAAD